MIQHIWCCICFYVFWHKKIGVQFPKVSSPQNHQTTYLGPRPNSRTSHRNWAATVVFSHCPKRFWWCCFSMAASAEQLGRSWVKPWLWRFWSKILWQRQGVVSTSSEAVDLLVWSVGSGSWSPRQIRDMTRQLGDTPLTSHVYPTVLLISEVLMWHSSGPKAWLLDSLGSKGAVNFVSGHGSNGATNGDSLHFSQDHVLHHCWDPEICLNVVFQL